MQAKILTILLIFFIGVQCSATPKKRSFGQVIDDNVILVKLKTRFIKDKKVPSKDISIQVWKGVVTLKGELQTQEQINHAIELAEMQKGVREVKTYLVLNGFGELKKPGPGNSFKSIFKKKRYNKETKPVKDEKNQGYNEQDLLEKEEMGDEEDEL